MSHFKSNLREPDSLIGTNFIKNHHYLQNLSHASIQSELTSLFNPSKMMHRDSSLAPISSTVTLRPNIFNEGGPKSYFEGIEARRIKNIDDKLDRKELIILK